DAPERGVSNGVPGTKRRGEIMSIESRHLARTRILPALAACVALGLAHPTPGLTQPSSPSRSSQSSSGTKATVACRRLSAKHIRCTMALKGGAAISGTVSMRISRGKQLIAVGQGRVTRGKATLTMHLLSPMTRGGYTVAMVVTLKARMVLRVP